MKKRVKSLPWVVSYASRNFVKFCLLWIFSLSSLMIQAQDNQRISIDLRGETLEAALWYLQNRTKFVFMYGTEDIANVTDITIKAKDKTITEILDECLEGTNLTYEISGSAIVIKKKQSQKVTISGWIRDASGEALPGATVTIRGSKHGAIAGLDGHYTFNIPAQEGLILTFSFIGMEKKTLKYTGKKTINVTLTSSSTEIDEVVVTGYQNIQRRDLVGSITTIKAKDIIIPSYTTIDQMLQGRVAGMVVTNSSSRVGTAPKIQIRGTSTLQGNRDPLWVVDGIIQEDFQVTLDSGDLMTKNLQDIIGNQISWLNPADIENITILKDASAAVYGFKGANGVILVTTKKGEIGKPKINYNGYVGLQNITRYPEYYNGYEYATLYNEAQQNIGVSAPYSAEDLERFKQGIGTTDWYDEVIRKTAPTTYHNLSVSGGAEKVKYFFSLGFTDQEGIYKSKAFNYKKYNVRSNISAEIVKGFTVDLQLSGRLDTRMKPYEAEPLSRSIQMAKPIFPIYANNNPDYWSNPGDKGNPVHLSDIDNVGYDRRDRREFNGSITLNWEVPWVKGLSAKALLSYDYNNKYSRKWYKEYYEYTYDAVNDVYNKSGSHTISELTTQSDNYFKPNGQISLNYKNTFGKHDVGVLALWEFYNDRTDWVKAYRQFTVGAIDQIGAGDKTNINNDGKASVSAHTGLVGRINYAFASKYLAEFSFRYDGSYKFAPGKRWGFFPAGSLGWRISEEDFFKESLPMFDNFKIRGSYGKVGDEGDFAAYQYLTGYTYPSGNYVLGSGGLTNGAKDKGMPNTNLTWYESTTANVGFEASVLSGLINVEFDYFIRKRDGLLATRILTLPTTFGQSLPQENLNSDKTQGFEIVLGHRKTIGDFTYDVKANFSTTRNYNRHVERAASANMYDNWRNNSNDRYKDIQWGKVCIGQFQSYEEILNSPVQDNNGNKSLMPGDLKFEDWNNDGIIDGKDDQPIGFGNTPRMYYGLNLYGEYKGFDLTVFFQGAAGHEVFTTGDFMAPFIQQGLGNGITLNLDRWHREDPSDMSSEWIPGYMPALRPTGFSANASKNTWTRQKANYLRLKTIEIGYTFPKKWMQRAGIENLRVYVNSFNTATITSRTGIMKYMDPENSESMFRYYPQMKTFNFGVNLTF